MCNSHFAPEHKNELVNTHTVILMFIQAETGKETGIGEGKKRKTQHSPVLMILQGPEGGFMGSAFVVE